jgi:hypothetical protein
MSFGFAPDTEGEVIDVFLFGSAISGNIRQYSGIAA